jgi:Peptidase propeptide and YPEB domain
MMNRRLWLSLMLASCLSLQQAPARADDDGGSDGGGGSGNSGSGNSGSGNSGSGSGNSGSGNQNGDDDGNEEGDDHGSSSSRGQSRARNAVKSGNASSLKDILAKVKKQYPGDIVSVSLRGSGRSLSYAIKVVDTNNRLIMVNVNAKTGAISLY